MTPSTDGTATACADRFFALIATDKASGWTGIPAGIRSLAALRRHTGVGYYLTEAIPYDGAECSCPKDRELIPDHAAGCLMTTPANRTAWQAWQALQGQVEQEVDCRLAAGELDQVPAPALVRLHAEAVLALIAEDKQDGGPVPPWVFSFSGLHDWVDANTYLTDAIPQAAMTAAQWSGLVAAVENEVNDRMVAAELAKGRQLTEPGDGFTEITTQCCHRFAVRLADVAGQTVPCPGRHPRTAAPCRMPLLLPAAAGGPVVWVRWGRLLPGG